MNICSTYRQAQVVFLITGIFILFLTGCFREQGKQSAKPNIILILVDDMGWNGLSSYGNRHVATPNIDRLADQGMKFTQAYVAPECTPTRGELLSGQYGARTGITQVQHNRVYPDAPLRTPKVSGKLPDNNYTLANMLRDAGYITAISGKWHVGIGYRVGNMKKRYGKDFFDSYGFDYIGDAAERSWSNNYEDYSDRDKEKANMDIVNDILQFVEENKKQPFFAYLSFFSPHTPIVAPDSVLQEFLDRGYPKTTNLFGDATEKPTADYAAMIKYLDHCIGKLLDNLEKKGLSDETLIIFTSDNGGLNRAWDNYPLRGAKGQLYEGGIRVPMIVKWPGKIPAGTEADTPVHIVDLYPTFKDIAEGKVPEHKILDGKSLLPVLTEREEIDREALYWHHPHYMPDYGKTPNSAIREGDYKLIHYYGDYLDTREHLPVRGKPYGELKVGEKIELFNIRKDPREQYDLSEKMPEKTEKMLNKLKEKLSSMNAPMPEENPESDLSSWFKFTLRN